MSSTGNRDNPNLTRTQGRQDQPDSRPNTDASGQPDLGKGGGLSHQESRDHNKHNNPGQSGHKPQQHKSAEAKH
jgi:hypothetical protein